MIEGLNELNAKISRMCSDDFTVPMRRAMLVVQDAAKGLCVTSRVSGGGELRGSILTDVKAEGDSVTGTCYTNKEYAAYVEFGTGPRGQESHAGVSPNIAVSYRQQGWLIPARAMSQSTAEAYGFPVITGEDGEVIGYATKGQRAQPFMYPALKDNEKYVVKELSKAIKTTHEGICND